ATGVILVGRQGNGGQDANDGYHNHQLDQSKTTVFFYLHNSLPRLRHTSAIMCSTKHASSMQLLRNRHLSMGYPVLMLSATLLKTTIVRLSTKTDKNGHLMP